MNNNDESKTLKDVIDEFLIWQESVRNLSKNTVISYKNDLEILTRLLNSSIFIKDITLQNLRSCISTLSKEKKAATSINRFISAVRSLFAYCRRLGYLDVNVALSLKNVKVPTKVPRYMTQSEVDTMCNEPHNNELLWEQRDSALFEIMYSSGCRVSEIANLSITDLAKDLSSAIVKGKGNKDRRVFFTKDAVDALKEYLPLREKLISKVYPTKKLFINQKGGALTTHGIYYIISRYSSSEGTNKPINPHGFRHTFATSLLSNGADVRVVQELLGHSNISTTQRYTHVTTEQLINIYNLAHPHGNTKE